MVRDSAVVYLTPFIPLSFKGEGEGRGEGLAPLFAGYSPLGGGV